MNGRWKRGLALSLGSLTLGIGSLLAPAAARAGEGVPTLPGPVGQPIAQSGPSEAVTPRVDALVRPTAFTTGAADPAPAFRAPAVGAARPLPIGPQQVDASAAPYTWRQAPTPNPVMPDANGSLAAPTLVVPPDGPPTTVAPPGALMPPGTVLSPGTNGAPIWSGPGGSDGCGVPGGLCGDPTCCNPCGSCCNGFNACCGDGCCFGNRFYGGVEYLYWWVRGQPIPPLVTTGSLNDSLPGALGQANTSVLFGGNTVGSSPRSGLRGTVGWWFTDDHALGIEATVFGLENKGSGFSATSFGSPVLTRPFVDATTGAQSVELVAAPGVLAGTVSASTSSQFYGAEVNLRRNLCCGCDWYVDGLLGFRYLGLKESVSIDENLTVLMPGGGGFLVHDRFGTRNNFYGTQLGAYGEYRWGRFSLGVKGAVALGTTEQIVDISGSTRITSPGSNPANFPGGLLTQTTNIGRHTRDVFGVVPEVGLNLGYQWTDHIRTFVGYNFIYWNSVARPGNQIDPGVNPNLLPPVIGGGPNRPAFHFSGSEFWAQGVTFGVEFRW